ncbi:U4/U6.U5 tri-snRNP-associated protein 3 [Microdochium nivale]|nr:U4/U6.U5 tri-snRNP-associated protein 3 [Microdochium nivale]
MPMPSKKFDAFRYRHPVGRSRPTALPLHDSFSSRATVCFLRIDRIQSLPGHNKATSAFQTMADHSRRGRNRPDSSQMWEEADRRSNHARHDQNGAAGRRNDRGGSDNHNRRNNRSRSRSPRRDRDRDDRNHRTRDREYDNNDRRHRGFNNNNNNRKDKRDDDQTDNRRGKDSRADGVRDDRRRQDRHEDTRSSRSPGRNDRETSLGEHNPPLPSRPKTDRPSGKGSSASTPLSFRVGNNAAKGGARTAHDARTSIEDDQEHHRDSRDESANAEERRVSSPGRRDREDEDAMDEDTRREDGEHDDDDEDEIVEDDGGMDMAAMMGFGGFGSTKGQKVTGNNAYYVRKEKKTEYRQYMNRVGGFNRPLSPGRD